MGLVVRKYLFNEIQNDVQYENIQQNAIKTLNNQKQYRETFNTIQASKKKTSKNDFVSHQEMREYTAWKKSLCLELVEEYLQ